MHPLTLSFADRALEAEFWASFARARRRFLQIGIVLLGVLYAGFALVDAMSFRDRLPALLFVRFAVALPLMVVAWPLVLLERFRGVWERRAQEILLWEGVVATGGILVMARLLAASADARQVIVGSLAFLVTLTFLYGFTQMRFSYVAALGPVTTGAGLWMIRDAQGVPSFVWAAVVLYGIVVNAAGFWVGRTMEQLARRDFARRRAIEQERARSERLLSNALPAEIAQRLLDEEADLGAEREALAERHDLVTVLVADIAGFTPLAERLPEADLARLLDRLFSTFDGLAAQHGVEKIKTLGDAWIAAAGVPRPRSDHAEATARLALDMLAAVDRMRGQLPAPVDIRVGVESGPAVAGVIGRTRFAYDLWGEAVDGAKAAEHAGVPGRVRVGRRAAALLPADLAEKVHAVGKERPDEP